MRGAMHELPLEIEKEAYPWVPQQAKPYSKESKVSLLSSPFGEDMLYLEFM